MPTFKFETDYLCTNCLDCGSCYWDESHKNNFCGINNRRVGLIGTSRERPKFCPLTKVSEG